MTKRWEHAARSAPGRVWIAAFSCCALLPAFGYLALLLSLAIGLASFHRQRRRPILSAVALAFCAINFFPRTPEALSASIGLALLCAAWIGALLLWTSRLSSGNRSRAVLWLHAAALAAIAAIVAVIGRSLSRGMAAAAMCALVPELLWRSAYWIKWRIRQPGRTAVWSNLFAALPFLGAGGVPLGKGPAFLAKHEAADEWQLASAQLEGVKLLALALVWRAADAALLYVFWATPSSWLPAWSPFSRAPLPSMEVLMRIPASFALWQRWGGLYVELAHNIVSLAYWGHAIVGVFCLMGFRIPRNTQAPLLATTILDFWGRYYFYFKELLMDFFFFPAFLRTSAAPVLWRTALATCAAAFFGNLYYHLVLYSPLLATGDAHGFLSMVYARAVYCALLAAGLCASFIRALKKPAPSAAARRPWLLRRLTQTLVVATFYALLHVWNYGGPPIPLERRMHLWKTLVGMETDIHIPRPVLTR